MPTESKLTDEQANQLGLRLIELLGLKRKRSNGRVDTEWGDKEPQGLGYTVERVVLEAQFPTDV